MGRRSAFANEYEKSDMKNRKNSPGYSAALSDFNDFCYGKFPAKVNGKIMLFEINQTDQ